MKSALPFNFPARYFISHEDHQCLGKSFLESYALAPVLVTGNCHGIGTVKVS